MFCIQKTLSKQNAGTENSNDKHYQKHQRSNIVIFFF